MLIAFQRAPVFNSVVNLNIHEFYFLLGLKVEFVHKLTVGMLEYTFTFENRNINNVTFHIVFFNLMGEKKDAFEMHS